MNELEIRLKEITINNFKNVINGTITIPVDRETSRSSILGIYGQNGSGKTAVIDLLGLVKELMSGKSLNKDWYNYINAKAKSSKIKLVFELNNEVEKIELSYSFELLKDYDTTTDIYGNQNISPVVKVVNEVLAYSYENILEKLKLRKSDLINTIDEEIFGPVSKYECLFNKDKSTKDLVKLCKLDSYKKSKSFIFNPDLLALASKEVNDEEKKRHLRIIKRLLIYANNELYVFNESNSILKSFNLLPLSYKVNKDGSFITSKLLLPLDKDTTISRDIFDQASKIIDKNNILLDRIVPGLKLKLNILKRLDNDNYLTELVSVKDDYNISFKYESEGIKRIVYLLNLLILVYVDPSSTVLIDELDSSIFEYLLGELIEVMSMFSHGELIFTSHNFRPLEKLDKNHIVFTTTNPSNRYIKLANVKPTNNLRNFYYRDIIFNEQSEQTYQKTDNISIARGFDIVGYEDEE